MTEVEDFAQEDLDEDDVMLLDTWEEVRSPGTFVSLTLTQTEAQGSRDGPGDTDYSLN